MKKCVDCGKEIHKRSTRCHSCANKKRYENPEERARLSARMKVVCQDPKLRARISKRMKAACQDPEFRVRLSQAASYCRSPEHRAEQSKRMKAFYQDPERKPIQLSSEYRAAQSEQMKARWQDPEYRAKRRQVNGENNPAWKGGTSFEPYGLDFDDKLKQAIRKRDNHTCAISGEPGRCVHHIDYNKLDSRPENLITLCRSCHTKTNHDRDRWEALLSPIAIERTCHKPSRQP